MTNYSDKMIGRAASADHGVGGGGCPCCGEAPGKDRKRAKRTARRRERQGWKAEAAAYC